MKNSLTSIVDKILLGKRALIETINDELKTITRIEHFRIVLLATSLQILCCLLFFEKKPAIDVHFVNDGQLLLSNFILNSR